MTKSRYKESPLYNVIRKTDSDKFLGVLDNLLKESNDKANLLKSHVAEDESALKKILGIVSENEIFELIEILKKHFTDQELKDLFDETLLFSSSKHEDADYMASSWDKGLEGKIWRRIQGIKNPSDFINKVEEALNPESLLGHLMLFDRKRSTIKNKHKIPRFNQYCVELLSDYINRLDPSIENYENKLQIALNTQLLFAVVNNNIEGVESALHKGADINYQDELYIADGYNALHAACAGGHYHIVKLLLKYSPNHLKLTNSGLTAQQLAKNNHLPGVAKLLQQCGTDVKAENLLPLRTAALSGNIHELVRLLQKEKDPSKIISEPVDGVKYLGEIVAFHHNADLLIDYIRGLQFLGVSNADIIKSLPQSAADPTAPGNKIADKYYSQGYFKEDLYQSIKTISDPILRAQKIREALTRAEPLGYILFQQRGKDKSIEVKGVLEQLCTLYESTLSNNKEIPDDMKREGLLFLNNIRLNYISYIDRGILTRMVPKEAEECLKNGASVNFRNSNNSGYTALHVAIIREDYAVAKWLVENGADPKIKDDFGKDAFSYLTEGMHNLRYIPDAQPALPIFTPRILGTCINHVMAEKLLVSMRNQISADINQKDETGKTALDYALLNGNSETVRFLLSNGGSLKQCKGSLEDYFRFHLLEHHLQPDMISILVEQAQQLNIDLTTLKMRKTPLGNYLLENRPIKQSLFLIDTLQKYHVPDKKIIDLFGHQLPDVELISVFFLGYGNKEIMVDEYINTKNNPQRVLADCEDLLNRNNPKGHLLFLSRGFSKCRETKGSLGKVLKHYEQTLNKNPSVPDHAAKLAYVRNLKAWNAAYEGNEKELLKLKKEGADLNFINPNHPDTPTPLSIAIKRNKAGTVKWLIENGAQPTKSMQSIPAPNGLIARGTYKVIQTLLTDYQKTQSPLHTQFLHAVKNGNVEGVREALGRGAHIDAQIGENDESALLVAIDAGRHHLVSVLIAAGAEVAFPDKHGMNSLHSAIIQGNLPLIRQLLGSVNNSTQLQKLLTANYVDEAANIYERFLTYGDEVNERLLTLYSGKGAKDFKLTPLSLAEVIGDQTIMDTIRSALAREKLPVPPSTSETPAASIPTTVPYEPVPYPDPFNFQPVTPAIYPALPKFTLTKKLAAAKKATLNGDIKLLSSILTSHPTVANELLADENDSLWKDAFVKIKAANFPELINVLRKHGMQETKIISLLPQNLDDHVKHQKRAIIQYLHGVKDPQTRANEMRLAMDGNTAFGYTILRKTAQQTHEFTELADEYEKLIRENFQLANREEALEFVGALYRPFINTELIKLRQTLKECAPEKRTELAQSLLMQHVILNPSHHLIVRELLKHGANLDPFDRNLGLQASVKIGAMETIDILLAFSPDPSAEPALFEPKYYDSDNNNISSLARVTFRQPITKLFAFINLLRFHNIAESKIIQLLPNNPSFIFKSTYKDEILARLRSMGNLENQIEEYERHLGINGETVEHSLLSIKRGSNECYETTGTLGKALDDYEKLLETHPDLTDREDKLKHIASIRLYHAAREGKSVKILEGLIKKGADVNYVNPYGEYANTTAIDIAAKKGKGTVLSFLQKVLDLNRNLINHIRARKSDIQSHIKSGADINGIIHAQGEIVTPIMSAIFTKNLTTVKKVHHAGANLWRKNAALNPIVCAVMVNSKEIFNYLLEHTNDNAQKTRLLNERYSLSKTQLQQLLNYVEIKSEESRVENIKRFIAENDQTTYALTLPEIADLFDATEIAPLLRPAASASPQPSAPPIEELVAEDAKQNKQKLSSPSFFATSKIDSKKEAEQYINQATQDYLAQLQEKTAEIPPSVSNIDTTAVSHAKDDLLAELDIMSDDAKASRWYSIPTDTKSQLPTPLQPQNIVNQPPPKYSEHPTVTTQFAMKSESDTKASNKENKKQKKREEPQAGF